MFYLYVLEVGKKKNKQETLIRMNGNKNRRNEIIQDICWKECFRDLYGSHSNMVMGRTELLQILNSRLKIVDRMLKNGKVAGVSAIRDIKIWMWFMYDVQSI